MVREERPTPNEMRPSRNMGTDPEDDRDVVKKDCMRQNPTCSRNEL
jgi:hypothetical protein